MSTLLLRLAGPLQSWGTSSKYDCRVSGREPSKSGVIGMISSAMGRNRDESIEDLSSLRFGVRIDQEGVLLRDFHMAHTEKKDSFVTNRYYLADAIFLIGLEGERSLLESIESALHSPAYPLFLGRRSCPPSDRVCLGIKDDDLETSLKNEEWLASKWYKKKLKGHAELELVMDSKDGIGASVRDNPVSFSQSMRQHSFRTVTHDVRGCIVGNNPEIETDVNPFNEMQGSK